MSSAAKAGPRTDLQRLRASPRFLFGGAARAILGMYVLCLFSQGSSEPEPEWCISLEFRFCRQSCPWQPRPKLAQLGGRRTLPTCLANDAFAPIPAVPG